MWSYCVVVLYSDVCAPHAPTHIIIKKTISVYRVYCHSKKKEAINKSSSEISARGLDMIPAKDG